MAKYGQADTFILIDGFDISGNTFELTAEIEALAEQSDGFGDSWVEQTPTKVFQGTISHRSFYDDAIGSTNAALVGSEGNARVLTAGIEGNVQGKTAVCCAGILQSRVARSASRGELQKISADYSGDRMQEATIIQSLADEAGDGATSDGSHQFDANHTGGRVYLQVTNITLGGYDDVDVVVEDSDDGDVWVTLAEFSGITTRTAASIAVSREIEAFVRTSLAWNGTGAAESITLLTALAVGPVVEE